jgi:hypothetical protein
MIFKNLLPGLQFKARVGSFTITGINQKKNILSVKSLPEKNNCIIHAKMDYKAVLNNINDNTYEVILKTYKANNMIERLQDINDINQANNNTGSILKKLQDINDINNELLQAHHQKIDILYDELLSETKTIDKINIEIASNIFKINEIVNNNKE